MNHQKQELKEVKTEFEKVVNQLDELRKSNKVYLEAKEKYEEKD